MTACGMNHVTPTMIKNGQMSIGDKIILEDDIPVGAEIAASANAMVEAELPEPTVSEVSAEAAEETAVETAAASISAEATDDGAELEALSYGMGNVSRSTGSGEASVQAPPPNWPNRPDPLQYAGESRNLISYPRMTNYFRDSVSLSDSSDTPSFTVPSNPMTPPEYTQTLDYDSIQYMNGFLRTQIGRFVHLEQLVGSNTIEDREGFLVGVSNNYILLQEIGTGNIMTFDLFSIKFVYIYYEDIPRPQSPA